MVTRVQNISRKKAKNSNGNGKKPHKYTALSRDRARKRSEPMMTAPTVKQLGAGPKRGRHVSKKRRLASVAAELARQERLGDPLEGLYTT